MRFLADLVNCHVIVASSLLTMFDSLVEVTLDDNISQVSRCNCCNVNDKDRNKVFDSMHDIFK